MNNSKERCSDCEVFKNYEEQASSFAFGFHCPIVCRFVAREDNSCEWIVSDNLPF